MSIQLSGLRRLCGRFIRWLMLQKRLPERLSDWLKVKYFSYRLLRQAPGTLLDQTEYRSVLKKAKLSLGTDVEVMLEFGTFAGDSLVVASQEFPAARKYAFDSFQGLPMGADEEHGEWYEGQFLCPFPVTVRNMLRQGVDPLEASNSIEFIKGWFADTCTPELSERISRVGQVQFVMVDCDLKSACDEVLRFVSPLLAPHAVIVYDDWASNNPDDLNVGIKESHSAWLLKNPQIEATEIARYPQNGRAFLVEIKTP